MCAAFHALVPEAKSWAEVPVGVVSASLFPDWVFLMPCRSAWWRSRRWGSVVRVPGFWGEELGAGGWW